MLRLVLDTDVIVAALRSPQGASAALLNAADRGTITLLASVTLVLEYEAKCTTKEHYSAAGISKAKASAFVDGLISLLEPIETFFSWRPQLPDANDEMVLETAINGRADGIVTFNLRDFGTAPERFGIQLWQPSEVIKRIRI